jgi:hypothetical protein
VEEKVGDTLLSLVRIFFVGDSNEADTSSGPFSFLPLVVVKMELSKRPFRESNLNFVSFLTGKPAANDDVAPAPPPLADDALPPFLALARLADSVLALMESKGLRRMTALLRG